MNKILRDVDRVSIIKATAVYLLVYAVLNTCGGVGLALLGRFAENFDLASARPDTISAADLAALSRTWESLGDFSLVIGVFYLISVPVFAAVAWGLWKRKRWTRVGAMIALGFTFVLSLIMLVIGVSVETLLWILISGFGIYLYWTDEGIKRALSQ
ncbi:MAG: hypothetical protein ABI835_03965 [Chloroflexota bacterium]